MLLQIVEHTNIVLKQLIHIGHTHIYIILV
uniref:Uncharacterized protein n=1 Tax=Siphoviridae sp. ctLqe90 TaxID=2825456 RepID=A0A8S5Q203_9CAUD|nr:MAG TPA: hypothetical protein [Siphoviridae sp. ctLqe90]